MWLTNKIVRHFSCHQPQEPKTHTLGTLAPKQNWDKQTLRVTSLSGVGERIPDLESKHMTWKPQLWRRQSLWFFQVYIHSEIPENSACWCPPTRSDSTRVYRLCWSDGTDWCAQAPREPLSFLCLHLGTPAHALQLDRIQQGTWGEELCAQ